MLPLSPRSKTGAWSRCPVLATKGTRYDHAKGVNPSALIARRPTETQNEVTTPILKRSIQPGGFTTNRTRPKAQTLGKRYEDRLHLALERTTAAARVLKFAQPPNLWGISLDDYARLSQVVTNMARFARLIAVALGLAILDLVTPLVSTAKAPFQFFVCSQQAILSGN